MQKTIISVLLFYIVAVFARHGSRHGSGDDISAPVDASPPSSEFGSTPTKARRSNKRAHTGNICHPSPRSENPDDACLTKDEFEVGQFDLYQLSQSWAPTFCLTHANTDECQNLDAWGKNHFTLHGLWPGFLEKDPNNCEWPESCACGDTCTIDDSKDLPDKLKKYGPGYLSSSHGYDNYLAHHEWCKHGTCTGFKPKDYFQAAIDTFLNIDDSFDEGTPTILVESNGQISLRKLLNSYQKNVVVNCDKRSCTLSEVISCWDASSPPKVGAMIDCPAWSHSSCSNCDYLDVPQLQ